MGPGFRVEFFGVLERRPFVCRDLVRASGPELRGLGAFGVRAFDRRDVVQVPRPERRSDGFGRSRRHVVVQVSGRKCRSYRCRDLVGPTRSARWVGAGTLVRRGRGVVT